MPSTLVRDKLDNIKSGLEPVHILVISGFRFSKNVFIIRRFVQTSEKNEAFQYTALVIFC